MHTAIARFFQYLAVERNASPHTVKSYREDLTTLMEYLADGPRRPAAGTGRGDRCRVAVTWRRCTSRATPKAALPGTWPRCGDFSASVSAKAGPRPIRPNRCAARVKAARCPISFRPRPGPALRGPAGWRSDGTAGSGHSGDDVFRRPACQRGGRSGRRRLGFRRRRGPRPRQGPARTAGAGRFLRHPGLARLAAGTKGAGGGGRYRLADQPPPPALARPWRCS